MSVALTSKEKEVVKYIAKNLNKQEFMVYEIFSDRLTDDEINGVVGSLTKKGVIAASVKGIFKLHDEIGSDRNIEKIGR